MNHKLGRNDPCPCGSGKKYKHCCLKAEQTKAADSRADAINKAVQWLLGKHDKAVWAAIDDCFFGGLDDDEYACLQELPEDDYGMVMLYAMEWLLADGVILIKGEEFRVADMLFGKGGPLLSAEQRQWLEALTAMPLRLYEITEVNPGSSLTLCDVLLPDRPTVLVYEQAGSQMAIPYDLIGARVVPVDGHYELSGAVYPFNRNGSWGLLEELRDELQGVEPDSLLAKEITSLIIPDYWLGAFLAVDGLPELVDQSTGEPLVFVTDHYRVKDWEALELALSREESIEGNREAGWDRLFEGEDGQLRSNLNIELGKHPDRIKVSYRTQSYADKGRPWFEKAAGKSIAFISREITDPIGILANPKPDGDKQLPPAGQLPLEVLTELMGKAIHQHYAGWADETLPVLGGLTPREAIQTPEGLEQVKFLLHTYEHGEAQLARDQSRDPVSYGFLWQTLGIKP
jgi:SEC-C motif